mmetsp:Transcript_26629/g.48590  ORF Transcript_26629/g.48590 Transcript_26629/m.48590 type:complete len:455 (+) Transcript_26629:50-1414(+)
MRDSVEEHWKLLRRSVGALFNDCVRSIAPQLQAAWRFTTRNPWTWYASGGFVVLLTTAVVSRHQKTSTMNTSSGSKEIDAAISPEATNNEEELSAGPVEKKEKSDDDGGVKIETMRLSAPQGEPGIGSLLTSNVPEKADVVNDSTRAEETGASEGEVGGPSKANEINLASDTTTNAAVVAASTASSADTNAAVSSIPSAVLLLDLKETCMNNTHSLGWSVDKPLAEWGEENVQFVVGRPSTADAMAVSMLDLGVKMLEAGRKLDFELKLDIALLAPLFSSFLVSLVLEGNNGVSGSISVLSGCPCLEEALLGVTALVGDVSVFSNCPKIKRISLGGGRSRLPITGSVEVFAGCPDLVSLKVFKGALSGDVAAFASTPNLELLNIPKTAVKGDVSVFGFCPKLKSCTLSLTKIKGSIKSFEGCPELAHLSLRGVNGIQGTSRDLAEALPDCVVVI